MLIPLAYMSLEDVKTYIDYIARILEIVGVLTIAIGAGSALIRYFFSLQKVKPPTYKELRHDLGKAILLGLEILVAADITATVVTEPTMTRVLTLGIIVLIRTFLSLSLQVELEGKFPWQKNETTEEA